MFGIVSLTMRSVPGQATVAQDKDLTIRHSQEKPG